MAVELISLIFFVVMVVTCTLVVVLSIPLFKATKGATKAWFYFVIYALFNALMSAIGLIRNFLPDHIQTVLIFHSMSIIGINIFIILSATKFVKDFGLENKYLTAKSLFGVTILLYVVLLYYNIFVNKFFNPQVMYSIACFVLSIIFILCAIVLFRLVKLTKKIHWTLLFLAWVASAFLILSLFVGNCCEPNGIIAQQGGTCGEYDGIYLHIFPTPCSNSILWLYWVGIYSCVISSILVVSSEYIFWDKLARKKPSTPEKDEVAKKTTVDTRKKKAKKKTKRSKKKRAKK